MRCWGLMVRVHERSFVLLMLRTLHVECVLSLTFLFNVAAELETHGREKFACKIRFAARREPLVKRVG